MKEEKEMKDRLDKIDDQLRKIRDAQVVANSVSRQTVTYYQLRELRSAVQAILYTGVFDDMRFAEIGTPEAVNRLEDACRELGLIQKQRQNNTQWSTLDLK